jgi:DNA-binding NtrC family response regulator
MSATIGPRLCLIEDDAIMGESLSERFRLEGYAVDWFERGQDALARVGAADYAVAISDVRLPDMNGEELFRQLLAGPASLPPFIFITAYGAIDHAVQLLKLGAADYVTKPFDLDELVIKVQALSKTPNSNASSGPVLGVSASMRQIEAMLPRLAVQASTILITGDSGVGKEVVAREIHRLDARRSAQAFVAVNCGALPESLLEAELFGYEKGAFTGAVRAKKGVFEQADGGTLFLDEIGDMTLATQVRLLRAVQERQVMRLGGERPLPVDLRLVCATHQDLKQLVRAGRFREDLFYRVDVIHLRIPPLRERREDIPWFAQRFLREIAREHGGTPRRLNTAAEQALLAYEWPGNVRELKHCLERACILSTEETLDPGALFEGAAINGAAGGAGSLAAYLADCERAYILQALERHVWHIGQTASALGISRKNLWEKMKRLGINGPSAHDTNQPAHS